MISSGMVSALLSQAPCVWASLPMNLSAPIADSQLMSGLSCMVALHSTAPAASLKEQPFVRLLAYSRHFSHTLRLTSWSRRTLGGLSSSSSRQKGTQSPPSTRRCTPKVGNISSTWPLSCLISLSRSTKFRCCRMSKKRIPLPFLSHLVRSSIVVGPLLLSKILASWRGRHSCLRASAAIQGEH